MERALAVAKPSIGRLRSFEPARLPRRKVRQAENRARWQRSDACAPTAGGLHFRERFPRPGSSTKCQVSYDWSWPQEAPGAKTSLVQKRVEIALSVDRTALGLQ